MKANSIVKAQRPSWIARRRIVVNIPAPVQHTAVVPPEQHPDYFPVLKALNKKRVQGQIISITSYKPICSEWHEIHAVQLGYYPDQRRVVFVLVRFGGSE